MRKMQSGFTLVEIAIVLVIIGLLLGGVLKGQELVNSAKVKNLINDFRTVPVFVYGYQDRFRALPGDDKNAVAHLGAAATLSPTSESLANGRIEGQYNSTTATDESVAFWQQVRLANLAPGPTGFTKIADDMPTNTEGGRIGIQSDVPINNMTGSFFVCSDGIQGKFVKQIDITMDDGDTAKGSVQTMGTAGQNGTPPVATASIVDSQTYTVCMSF